jgi:hypothetical protein
MSRVTGRFAVSENLLYGSERRILPNDQIDSATADGAQLRRGDWQGSPSSVSFPENGLDPENYDENSIPLRSRPDDKN